MIPFFSKRLEDLSEADVQELVTRAWPEGYTVEYKQQLPGKKDGQDPWHSGGNSVDDNGRDGILAELVAFANAGGGCLVLGIQETKTKPPRADSIRPIERVGELSRRFEDMARDNIDPPLAHLQIRAIELKGTNSGVLVFRCDPSRSAPHRVVKTRDCLVRRGSSSVRMTMREIQDMSINTARGLLGIEEAFKRRQDEFSRWQRSFVRPSTALRITAIPLGNIPDPGPLPIDETYWRCRDFVGKDEKGSVTLHRPTTARNRTRPILRGLRHSQDFDGFKSQTEVFGRVPSSGVGAVGK